MDSNSNNNTINHSSLVNSPRLEDDDELNNNNSNGSSSTVQKDKRNNGNNNGKEESDDEVMGGQDDDNGDDGDEDGEPLPFNDEDEDDLDLPTSESVSTTTTTTTTNNGDVNNNNNKSQKETEEQKKERIEAIKAEKERLRLLKDEQKKQLAELASRQKEELQQDQERSAKDRLKFLLERTEIYSHFVSNSSQQSSSSKKKQTKEVTSTPTKRSAMTEKQEDEEIMKETIDEEAPHSFNFFTTNPPYIKFGQMRDYQIYGLNWLIQLYERGINGILADEMGLGKTLQTISLLGYLAEYKGIRGPHLIIAPKSTLSGWTKEFKNWCPFLRVVKFHGDKEERQKIKQEQLVYKKFDVCVTTYEMVIKEKSVFKKFSWRYIIIDEAHRIKNENSVLSKGVRLFNSQFRLLITGTPLQNNLHELWALLNFLLPDVFGSSEDFDNWFNLEQVDNQQEVIDKLHKVLRPFLLRRIKTEVEKSLPPKKEIKLYVGLSQMQKEWYKRLLSKDYEALAGIGVKGSSGKVKLLNICMQLRKACNHPYLFDGAEEQPYTTGEHLITNSGKMVLLDKLLKKLKERGSRVLIFSQMARLLDILEDYMLFREYKYCRIDGSTDSESRETYIDTFNAPKSPYFAFLLTTRAGGLGITLNTADVVVLFDSDWNPQMDLQAQDRAHRIGQTKPVTVYRFVTENTMEEKMVEKAEMKLHLDAAVIQQGRLVEANKSANPDELLSMIRFGADDIFRSKDSTITDDDIDRILQKGEEKTNQTSDRLKDLVKNPIKLTMDGNLYEYDGVNYRQQHNTNSIFGESFKRERKTLITEDEYLKQIGGATKKAPAQKKVERKFKAPKQPNVHDHQFYAPRLVDLLEKEMKAYNEKCNWYEKEEEKEKEAEARGEKKDENRKLEDEEPDFGDLTPEEQNLKERLLKTGFADWNKVDFRNYIRGCELYGRKSYQNIAETVETKTEKEVKEYSDVFWKRYKEVADWEKLLARIEKGEERILKYKETLESLDRKVSQYKNPWQQLKIQYGIKKNKTYNDEEDIFLVCMMHKLGYGAWDELKEEIRKAPQFRFDWMIQTRTASELKMRCDTLLRYIIKEEQDEEEKRKVEEKQTKKNEKSTTKKNAAPPPPPPATGKGKKAAAAAATNGKGKKAATAPPVKTSTRVIKRKNVEEEQQQDNSDDGDDDQMDTTTTTTTTTSTKSSKSSKYSDSEESDDEGNSIKNNKQPKPPKKRVKETISNGSSKKLTNTKQH